jgi:hypothetical protein
MVRGVALMEEYSSMMEDRKRGERSKAEKGGKDNPSGQFF